MKLLERLGVAQPAPAPTRAPATSPEGYGRQPVGHSADLNRIIALPRRDLAASYTDADIAALEASLRVTGPCVCKQQGRPCPTSLKRIQALALLEAPRAGGLMAPIGVGHGKTLIDLLLPMVMPGCKVAVLLIPANLRGQLLERDWAYYGGHWKLPNLAGGRWFAPGRPVLHVLTYSKLSSPDSSDLLKRIGADLYVCDEVHNLKDPKSARTIRFKRAFVEKPARLCGLSGTYATRSIRDGAHLVGMTFGDGSPFPLAHPTVEEWATAIDPCTCPAAKNPDLDCQCRAPPGALQRLCEPGEGVREGFRRRRNATLGVVATDESAIGISLTIRTRNPGPVPSEVLDAIDQVHEGERPDGDRFPDKLQAAACARQLSAGFFHRWRYPRGEPRELIDEWFMHRRNFNSEVWDKLKRPVEHLDSPGLLVKAAIRAEMDPPYDGDKPVWPSMFWSAWRDIHDKVQPVPEAVWVSDFVAQDAAKWAKKNVGIVWVEFPELGERIAKLAGVPYYGGGTAASDEILRETGKRSIVASIKAHGTGKNLQQWCRNLVVTPPADGATWEQLIARTHRPGQLADEVEVEVYLHTEDYRGAFARAQEYARFIQGTDGQPQKLLLATYLVE